MSRIQGRIRNGVLAVHVVQELAADLQDILNWKATTATAEETHHTRNTADDDADHPAQVSESEDESNKLMLNESNVYLLPELKSNQAVNTLSGDLHQISDEHNFH